MPADWKRGAQTSGPPGFQPAGAEAPAYINFFAVTKFGSISTGTSFNLSSTF
jgi:hypothetical protein